MKLLKIMQLGLLSLIFVFAGCQTDRQNSVNVIENPLERRIGVIKSLGDVPNSSGTHILTLDNGDTVFLKSDSVNLDDEKYKEKTVEVRGNISYVNSGKALMSVHNIDVIDQNYLPKEEEAAKWQMYEDELNGFSIKYHTSFEVKKLLNGVEFIKDSQKKADEDTENFDVKYVITAEIIAKQGKNLLEYLGLNDDPSSLLSEGYVKSRIGTQSLQGYKKQMASDISFILEGEDNFYKISYSGTDGGDTMIYLNMFYDMVSSFTLDSVKVLTVDDSNESGEIGLEALENDFLSSSEIVKDQKKEAEKINVQVDGSFTKLINETFDFSLMYPKSWYYQGTAPSETGSIRHYDFSTSSFDEDDAKIVVNLDIFNGEKTSGSELQVNGTKIYKETNMGGTNLYFFKGGKTYKVSGASSHEDVMLKMVSSIE
jgi:hypothetical protein